MFHPKKPKKHVHFDPSAIKEEDKRAGSKEVQYINSLAISPENKSKYIQAIKENPQHAPQVISAIEMLSKIGKDTPGDYLNDKEIVTHLTAHPATAKTYADTIIKKFYAEMSDSDDEDYKGPSKP